MNLIQKAKNLAETAMVWVDAGMPIVDKKTYDHRISICNNCPDLIHNHCIHCGCYMPVKAWLATEGCAHPRDQKYYPEINQ